MRYKHFIPGGTKVSEIGFGAWQLGVSSDWKTMTDNEAIKMVRYALDQGVNFFDTAPNYGLGTSESRLGKALKNTDRDTIVVNTKFGHTVSGGLDNAPENIRPSLEGSLKRLQLDYVDSLIFHNPPLSYFDGNKNDHYEILERLKEEGKIKAYGASVDKYEEMKLLMDTTNSQVVEAFFNIHHQGIARGFDQAKAQQIGIIAKVPLDSGWLTGKYTADSVFEGVRSRWSQSEKETRANLVQGVKEILGENFPLPQSAISFCLGYDAVSTVILGNLSISQLASNLESLNNPLPSDLIQELEQFYQKEIESLKLPW